MTLSSYDVFQQSRQLPGYQTSMLGQILTNETDPLFSWQYNEVCYVSPGEILRLTYFDRLTHVQMAASESTAPREDTKLVSLLMLRSQSERLLTTAIIGTR